MSPIKDAKEFFQQSAGQWRSQRTTHHLPFRRAESGGSDINVEFLNADDEKIATICQMHNIEATTAIGGAFVSWDGSMAWDKDNEDHKGTTVFALIPDSKNPRKGKLLRERGYAEIVPVAGEYSMDEEDGLVLITEYETMSIIERFWFVNPDLRLRSSTVKRFGGFNTATFCAESRVTTSDRLSETSNSSKTPAFAISGW
ncbi:phycobiliprotein lyase [Waterburya agarophytonicola K14]|uniref:Chromophore lyase CpcS/CpeS n=1 Tax=Waterburya agarophytonicola KI4 TaxID=2874699 RepID=A0A964BLU3_9CYAN|nr:phycobiliprotein lyase [Waterburya agarophytonicola]MCC0175755.1 phycobiliprotein lyase [Waterburya agarophytonicola KI4]